MVVKDLNWTRLITNAECWFGGIDDWKPFYIEKDSQYNLYIFYCRLLYRQEQARADSLEEAKQSATRYMQNIVPAMFGKDLRWGKDSVLEERYFGYVNDMPLYMVRLNQIAGSWTAAQYPIGFNDMIKINIGSMSQAMYTCQSHFGNWVRTLLK